MTVRNIIIRSCKNIEGSVRILKFVMKSINVQGEHLPELVVRALNRRTIIFVNWL